MQVLVNWEILALSYDDNPNCENILLVFVPKKKNIFVNIITDIRNSLGTKKVSSL